MTEVLEFSVLVTESGNGPYAQFVTIGHHVMGADEPEHLGGRDAGPSPYKYLLAGLGACTAMTMRVFANRHGRNVEHISVESRHEKVAVPDSASKVDRFDRLITLRGELTDEHRKRILEIADNCPISQTLRRPSIVASRLTGTEHAVAIPPDSLKSGLVVSPDAVAASLHGSTLAGRKPIRDP
jgi:putative redox protein